MGGLIMKCGECGIERHLHKDFKLCTLGFTECVNGHIVCNEHLSIEIDHRDYLPEEMCPLCNEVEYNEIK